MVGAVGIFAILNATEDSFSDGGRYLASDAAIARARQLIDDGADIIDLGAAASNPDAIHVPPQEEIARLAPVVAAIGAKQVSVDSFAPETQAWALTQNVAWLNDIQGFPEPALYKDIARSDVRLVVMHNVAPRGQAERIDTDSCGLT